MAKSVVYLHIGTPKTGTSAIQLFLVENRAALERKSWTYPDFGFRYTDASYMRNALWLAREMEESDALNRKKAMPQLFSLAEQYKGIILSEESLWTQGGFHEEDRDKFWASFNNELKARDIDLKVVVYLRRQDQYLYSYWAQKVKKRDETRLFSEFARDYGIMRTGLDYYKKLSLIAEAVGDENLIVRIYDRKKFEAGSIVFDFLSLTGIGKDDAFVFPKESNSSMSDCVLEAKRLMNQVIYNDRSTGYLYNALWSIQRELMNEGKLKNRNAFSNSERKLFMSAYEKTNEETARRFVYHGADNDKTISLFDMSDLEAETEEWSFETDEIAGVYNRFFVLFHEREERRYNRQKAAIEKARARNKQNRKRIIELKEQLKLEQWRANPVNRIREKVGFGPGFSNKKAAKKQKG